jgi:hypothetical protein
MTLKPPLKLAGGKRWLIPRLRPVWEPHRHRRLVEPFCGGLAVTFGLMPARALLNDINQHLINFYRWLKRGLVVALPMENDGDRRGRRALLLPQPGRPREGSVARATARRPGRCSPGGISPSRSNSNYFALERRRASPSGRAG